MDKAAIITHVTQYAKPNTNTIQSAFVKASTLAIKQGKKL